MSSRQIVAIGGGGLAADEPALERYVLSLVTAKRPKVCFLGTASGDDPAYMVAFYEAFVRLGCEPSVLRLFARDVGDLAEHVASQDVVYVGGGSTANLLVVWRRHGLDEVLASAWEAGVVLCGVSAGANCWFEASTTDSFMVGHADPLLDGLGLLAGSFCPHYDAELERRPRFIDLIASATLPPGYACDDGAALHFEGRSLRTAVAARPGAKAYRVDEGGVETSIAMTELA